ncbi:hypothetical protein KGA66_27390 [Actinocrinis puniceicyclus]|uniref:Uncharacterized protein n=1 Tax=Actinocrinis puniceicyclus TaxID=977794 RepID=A0A8J7WQR0_9ACTN|nr:hypothetical protein [Actinocrinis puniceicyclus]MBS2966791.1 hypothetical protein [Actinocrinis puniceicyclus]
MAAGAAGAAAVLGPALGNIGILYIAPLLVAHLVTRITDHTRLALGSVFPYVLGWQHQSGGFLTGAPAQAGATV